MMGRALIGAVAAAVVMFIIGFIFFATGLQRTVTGSLDDAPAAAVQQVLAANVPRTGAWIVPDPDGSSAQTVMYGKGPVATIFYNTGGFPAMDSGAMLGGFVYMLVTTLLLAVALYSLSQYVWDFRERAKILALAVLAVTVFTRLGAPIWYHHGWAYAIYVFIADVIALLAAGFVILKFIPAAVYRSHGRSDAPPAV